MSDWVRTTHECTLEGLPAEMTAAINRHLERHNLGLSPSDVRACVETTSTRVKKALFGGGDKAVQTGLVLAPGWLLWAIRADDPEVTVMSARLADVTVEDYAGMPLACMVPDSGVEITGAFTDVLQRTSAFVGLDDGPAAREFKQRLIEAVQAARS